MIRCLSIWQILSLHTMITDRDQEMRALRDHLNAVTAELEAAKEEVAVKVAQVKQYQKQVEAYKQVCLLSIDLYCALLESLAIPCSFKAQPKNEFEQLYNEEKQRNARLMEENNHLKNNDFEQLYHQVLQVNARQAGEIDRLKRLPITEASPSRQEENVSRSY